MLSALPASEQGTEDPINREGGNTVSSSWQVWDRHAEGTLIPGVQSCQWTGSDIGTLQPSWFWGEPGGGRVSSGGGPDYKVTGCTQQGLLQRSVPDGCRI